MRWASLFLFISSLAWAQAGVMEIFDADRFEAFVRQDRTILLHFGGMGCSACDAQESALKQLAENADVLTPIIFVADLRTEPELGRRHRVRSAGTILLFKGETLIGRSAGLLGADEMRSFIRESRINGRGRPGPRAKREYRPKR